MKRYENTEQERGVGNYLKILKEISYRYFNIRERAGPGSGPGFFLYTESWPRHLLTFLGFPGPGFFLDYRISFSKISISN